MDKFHGKCPADEDYYGVLGCSENSSIEQINAEYKIRAVKYHPDKSQDYATAEKFALIQRAKEILTDPELKAEYDNWLKCGLLVSFSEWMLRKNQRIFHWVEERKPNMICDKLNRNFDCTEGRDIVKMFRNYEI